VAVDEAGRTGDDDITVHCSVGLAGTEVLLGAALLDSDLRRQMARFWPARQPAHRTAD
jgi:hypothetical protein